MPITSTVSLRNLINYLLSFVNRLFSRDVTAAIFVYKTMNLCAKKILWGIELFSHVKTFF